MYLTKMQFSLANRTVQQLLGDGQKLHQYLTGLFGTDRQTVSLLYRVRLDQNQNAVYMYSSQPIDPARNDGKTMELAGQRDISSWVESKENGQMFRFDLIAIPTKKVAAEGLKNSRRRLLRSTEERLQWLSRKAEQNGFAICTVNELESVRQTANHAKESGGKLYLDGYHYRGVLRITDAEKFKTALQNGIGPAKAYGFGMLLLS